jgi:large subunit ribosomal protein L21
MVEKKTAVKKASPAVRKTQDTAELSKKTLKKQEHAENQPEAMVADAYAIFKNGGKQYQAIVGKTLALEKIVGEPGQSITFTEVMLRKTAPGQFEIGTPLVKDAVIKASILKHDKEKKVIVFKFKRRKKSRVKRGHRQPFTVVRIESI